jgi:hypothetical protein
MASTVELERILGKAVLGEKFREYLLKEPRAAAESVCVELAEKQGEPGSPLPGMPH